MSARRRRVLSLAGGLLAAVAGPARAQGAPARLRLGWLRPNAPAADDLQAAGVPAALKAAGWVEGRDLQIERRWADGRVDRLPALAEELARARCDVLLAVGSAATAAAMRAAPATPVVFFGNFDHVAAKLVASLARPGGNATGVLIAPDGSLVAKRLELLRDALPRASRIALLAADDPGFARQAEEAAQAAATLGLALPQVTVRHGDYARAFAEIRATAAEAVLVGGHTFFVSDRHQIVALLLRQRLASCWEWPEQVRDGGLMAYGARLQDLYGRLASFIDRLARGEPAAAMPVERPTRFDLVLNQKTARAIGLVLPQSLLLRADEVIA